MFRAPRVVRQMVLGCLARCLFIGLEADPGIKHQVKMTQYKILEFTINRQIFISRCCFVWCDLVFGGVATAGGDSHHAISVIPVLGHRLYTCEYRLGA